MRLTVRQVSGLKGYRTNGAIRLRARWRGSIELFQLRLRPSTEICLPL